VFSSNYLQIFCVVFLPQLPDKMLHCSKPASRARFRSRVASAPQLRRRHSLSIDSPAIDPPGGKKRFVAKKTNPPWYSLGAGKDRAKYRAVIRAKSPSPFSKKFLLFPPAELRGEFAV
jgi:hypothetical protein